ncbi:hypothetical protein ACFVX3_31575 [Rhodococcus erythropolis]
MRNRILMAFTAAVVAMAVFGSMQSTGALWSDQKTVPGKTVTAGELNLTVASDGIAHDNVDFADFAGTAMIAGDSVQSPLLVRNGGDIPLRVRLQSTEVSTSDVSLDLRVSLVASRAECSGTGAPVGTAIYDGPFLRTQAPSGNTWRHLSVGASEVWCFRATLATMPSTPTSFTTGLLFRAESR